MCFECFIARVAEHDITEQCFSDAFGFAFEHVGESFSPRARTCKRNPAFGFPSTWNDGNINQDDREINCTLKEQFANSSRISCLNINQLNYCHIRYIISKCALFIGARTHAVISAYSMCVPTIALGYSIKSRGIAKDLQLDSQLVVDSKNFTPESLIDSFNYLTAHEKDIRKHLAAIMPAYKQSTYSIRQQLQSLNTSSL